MQIRSWRGQQDREEMTEVTPTDWLNIVCFIIVEALAVSGIVIAIKMKLPVWKFQVGWISFMALLGVLLLASRLGL